MTDLYIDTTAELETLCARLRSGGWFTLDTEFMRERTYFPQLCLIQVANDEVAACIDPFAVPDLDPLLALLEDPALLKVLHAARQDLEIFHVLGGRVPAPVFDTQLAATLLGLGDQVGYANLVKARLGVELDKSQTRTDWSRRPLDPDQIRYAADDVRYLVPLYRDLVRELEVRGRLDWLTEDFAALSDPATYTPDAENLWRKVKGSNRLKGVQVAALQLLAAWREEQARGSDRPRRWVLSDEVLLEVARQMPDGRAKLERIRGVNRSVLDQHDAILLQRVREARDLPRTAWPIAAPRVRLSPEQEALVDLMGAVVRQRGVEQEVSPTAIASRRDLEALLDEAADTPLRHGWRARLAGNDLLALLRGERTVRVDAGRLQLDEGA